jgi:hypothetical protein
MISDLLPIVKKKRRGIVGAKQIKTLYSLCLLLFEALYRGEIFKNHEEEESNALAQEKKLKMSLFYTEGDIKTQSFGLRFPQPLHKRLAL